MKAALLLLLASLWGATPALAQSASPAPPAKAESVVPPSAPTPGPAKAVGHVPPAAAAGPAKFPTGGYTAYSFQELGTPEGLRLMAGSVQGGVTYAVRQDQVLTAIRLHLIVANSAGFPANTKLEVTVNGDPVGAVTIGSAQHAATPIDLPIDPILFGGRNRIGFKLTGVKAVSCHLDEAKPWLTIAAASAVDFTADHLPLANNLALLPLPFFDSRDPRQLETSFVFARPPGNGTLEAAGIVASWLGGLAGYRGVHLPAVFGAVPPGNAIVFALTGDSLPNLALPRAAGPIVALIDNPIDHTGKLLLIMGRNADDLKEAARGLALGPNAARVGSVAAISRPEPPPWQPYDAPGWISDMHPVKFADLTAPGDLTSRGLRPAPIDIDFRSAPDYFNWVDSEIPMTLSFGVAPEQVVDLPASRLDIDLNGSPFRSVPLADSGSPFQSARPIHRGKVEIPPFLLTGRNRLSFYFDLKPSPKCDLAGAAGLTEHIDPDSTIDLSQSPHYAPMPNLSFFANAGFPFTRLADLSETAVVMPDDVGQDDVEAYLDTMALFGAATGYPTLRAAVVGPGEVKGVASRDLVLIGAYPRQPLLAAWSVRTGISMIDGNLYVRPRNWWDRVRLAVDWRNRDSHVAAVNDWLQTEPGGEGAIIAFRSPLDGARSVVAITGTDPAHVLAVARTLQSNGDIAKLQGDLVVEHDGQIASFRVARRYDVGSLARWTWLRWNLSDQPIVIAILLLVACAALSAVAFVILGMKARRRLQGANR
jgi:Bacterial cellulose synthase subunit